MDEPLLLNSRQAAEALGVSERTLWSLAFTQKVLPFVRIGRSIRYTTKDLETFINSHREESKNA